MADDLNIQILGADECDSLLAEFGPEFARTAAVDGVTAMLEVLLGGAYERCPVLVVTEGGTKKAGELKLSLDIIMDPVSTGTPYRVGGIVTNTYNKSEGQDSPGVYGKFVEEGSVHNPVPRPFMRQTVDEDGEAALDACMVAIANSVSRQRAAQALAAEID